MSNEVNNLASSFVAMAQAFEKLPIVQQELEATKSKHQQALEHIQALELRLIDRANELDAAHASTRKAEVERDHAETMFLETDDKLGKAKDVLKVLIGDAGDFLRVVEPPKPEPVVEPMPEPTPTVEPGPAIGDAFTEPSIQVAPTPTVEAPHPMDPIAAPSWATAISPSAVESSGAASDESVASSTTDEALHHTATTSENVNERIHANNELADHQGVSVPSDPTPATESSSENASNASIGSELRPDLKPYAGKRYTDVPYYVSLVEWLNGGGSEAAYYAR